jgi:hypothetical protein
MRILIDENFPADFAKLVAGHEVLTIHGLGWSGIKNGELLRRASGNCDVFLTLDRNLEHQQNIKVLRLGVVLVRAISNRIADLAPLIDQILEAAAQVKPGEVRRVGA